MEEVYCFVFFFFFQAEDGIRDIGVTGVQTCALPISGLWYVTALCISWFFGLSTNFWLSRRFVFGVYWMNRVSQFAVFTVVGLISLLANLGLLQLLINELHWDATLSRLVSAGCVAILSFVGHKLYSFASNHQVIDRTNDT